jgi:hypothetical protein
VEACLICIVNEKKECLLNSNVAYVPSDVFANFKISEYIDAVSFCRVC